MKELIKEVLEENHSLIDDGIIRVWDIDKNIDILAGLIETKIKEFNVQNEKL